MTKGKNHIPASKLREEQLLVEAAQQNPRRFGALYERYYQPIFLFVFKRVGEEEVCADVTSQVFLKAMLNLKRYKFKGVPFSAWLYRIAINEVNQHFRETKNQRHITMESRDLPTLMDDVEEDSTDENIQRMVGALDTLSPDELQMVELRYFEKLPFREIAMIYNITENNAKVRMYRILGRMKKQMVKMNSVA